MSTLQSRRPREKGKKKTINIDPETPMMTMHNKVRNAKEEEEEGSLRESDKRSQACCASFKLQTLKSCLILRMPKLQICTQFRRSQSVHKIIIQFQNSFLVRLSFLWPNSDQKTTQLASNKFFWQNSLERVG